MMMRNIVISLGITTLSSLLLYMYFRNKMSDIENKVEIMFQLIQEHAAANDAAAALATVNSSDEFPSLPIAENIMLSSNSPLVDVSDDDGGSSSEEVSDSDDDDELISITPTIDANDLKEIKETLFQEANTIKKINFNIHGSETDRLSLNNLEELNMNNKAIHNSSISEKKVVPQEIVLEENTDLNLELNEISMEEVNAEKEEEEEEEEEEEDGKQEVNNIMVHDDILDFDILRKKTVTQLKEIAALRNLQKYKSLTKKRLIDLISNSIN